MKKLLGILVLSLLLSSNAYAGKWKVTAKNYYTEATATVYNKPSRHEAEKAAISKCKMNTFKEELKDGCLLFAILGGSVWDTLKGTEVEINVWNKEVDKFEKKIGKKPEDEKIYEWGTPICVKMNVATFISDIKNCSGGSAYVVNKYHSNYDYYFSLLSKTHKVTGKPEEEKPEVAQKPDDEKIIIIGSGSGFFVTNRGHIISNEHVVGVCKKVKAYEAGKEIYLDILATDSVNDIGLVKGKFKNKKYLNIKTDGAELGEDIVAFGYPLSQTLSDSVKLTKGIVSSLTGLGNNISQIQIDAAIQPGNSGGPVLNMNGQVVGIASAGLSKLYMAKEANYIPENVNFAVASQTLTAFLKAHKIKITSGPTRIYSTKELAKIGEPATIQLFCMNTREAYAKLKKANKHSDVLLDLQ